MTVPDHDRSRPPGLAPPPALEFASGERRPLARGALERVAVSVLVALALLAVAARPVSAREPLDCDRPVVDTSGLVDVAAVERAVDQVDPEAVVVVRTFDRVPVADLVAAVDEVVLACFGDPDLGVRAEVIVLGLSIADRLSDVLVGARWGVAVPDPDRIRSEVMAAYFTEGDYTGGLLAAIEEIDAGVDRQLAAEPEPASAVDDGGDGAGGQSPADAGRADGGDQPTIGSEVDDGRADVPTGQGRSPLAVGLAVLGVGACGGAIALVHRRRRLGVARDDLRRAMTQALSRLGVVRERDARLAAQSGVWTRTGTGRTLVALSTLIRQTESGRSETDRAAGMLHQVLPEGVDGADRDQLERGRALVVDLTRALDGHDAVLDRLAAFGAHLDHLRVALPAKADLLGQEVAEARQLADLRASEGWFVDGARTDLDRVAATVSGLDLAPLELDLLTLSEEIERAEGLLFATDHHLQSLPSQVDGLKQWSAELSAAAELELRRIEDLRRQLAAVAGTHAADSWRWATDHPEHAVDALERAGEIQHAVMTSLLPQQRFDDAGGELDRAGLELISADQLLDQVDDLLVDLERARTEAADIAAQSRLVLGSLADYLARHAADLEPDLLDRPAELGRAVDGLDVELQRRKPNYLRVAETGERLNRRIDELLAEAAEQHIAAEALRRELQRETARARRALSRARRALGWELFRSGDGAALDELEAILDRLPDDVAAAVEAAGDVADGALRIQERIIARRRRSGMWVTAGRSGGIWSGGGGGFGGSSGSSGGRSFGGGSSGGRSFGGGIRSSGSRSFGGGRSSGGF